MNNQPSSSGTVVLSRRKKIAFTIILLLIAFTVLEVAARFYLRKTQGYSGGPLLQYVFDPYKNVAPTPNFVDLRGLRHNAQGFRRSTDVTREKPAGTFRIFLMGGSTAYGTGGLWPHIEPRYPILKNTETIDAYLEQIFSERFPGTRFEVINAAIPSIWTHHHLIYLNQTILKYNPDMVILLDGYNDFYHFQPGHDQFASYAYQEHSRIIMGEPTLKSLAYVNMWWLGRKSAFAHVALRQARVIKQFIFRPHGEREPINVDSAMAGLQRNFPANALKMVERIAALLQQEKVEAAFVLQPMLVLERDRPNLTPMEQKLLEFNVQSYLPNYEPFMKRAVPYVSALEKETVERFGAVFLDATGIYRNASEQIFTDYVHLTPEANRMLALYIANGVQCRIAARLNNGTGVTACAGASKPASRGPLDRP